MTFWLAVLVSFACGVIVGGALLLLILDKILRDFQKVKDIGYPAP